MQLFDVCRVGIHCFSQARLGLGVYSIILLLCPKQMRATERPDFSDEDREGREGYGGLEWPTAMEMTLLKCCTILGLKCCLVVWGAI